MLDTTKINLEDGKFSKVKITINTKRGTKGLFVKQDYLDRRRNGEGWIHSYVAGHGGDLWWVSHSDPAKYEKVIPKEEISVYMIDEMEFIED